MKGARLLIVLALVTPALATAQRLAVFAPAGGRPVFLQRQLSQALPGVEVTVYGRPADLSRALRERPPDALLAPTLVLEQEGITPSLRGTRAGVDAEPWLLVSINGHAVAPTGRIGALDLVGRRQLPRLLARILGVSEPPPAAVGVNHLEDLLVLLELDQADAVLVPEGAVADFRNASRLQLVATRGTTPVGLISFGWLGKGAGDLERKLKGLPPSVLAALGLEGWK